MSSMFVINETNNLHGLLITGLKSFFSVKLKSLKSHNAYNNIKHHFNSADIIVQPWVFNRKIQG